MEPQGENGTAIIGFRIPTEEKLAFEEIGKRLGESTSDMLRHYVSALVQSGEQPDYPTLLRTLSKASEVVANASSAIDALDSQLTKTRNERDALALTGVLAIAAIDLQAGTDDDKKGALKILTKLNVKKLVGESLRIIREIVLDARADAIVYGLNKPKAEEAK